MKSGATQYIKDANVRRLQQLQEAAAEAFTTHVSRHRDEIAARHSYFQERFSILKKTVLDDRPATQLPDEEENEVADVGAEEDWHGLTPESGPSEALETVETSEKDAPTEPVPPPPDADLMATRRAEWAERRRLRKLRRQKIAPRDVPSAAVAKPPPPKEKAPDIMPNTLPPTPTQQQEGDNSAEELRVLKEIERFEELQRIRTVPPVIPLVPPAPEAEQDSSTSAGKRESRRFSFRQLFDLSPQFRDRDSEEEDNR